MSRPATDAEIRLGQQLCPDLSWDNGTVNEAGQSHTVLLANTQAVIRMARTEVSSANMPRSVRLHDQLATQLPYLVPTACSGIAQFNGRNAVAMSFIPGRAHEPHRGDPATLQKIVRDLAAVDISFLLADLAEPFAFAGRWNPAAQERCLEYLPHDLRTAAKSVFAQLPQLEAVPPSLVHGDLAGENMHWDGEKPVGILDWDLASAWDPALNTTYLALWHGQDLIEQIAPDAEQARRARIWLGLMGLERLADTLLRSDNPRVDKLMRKIAPRLHGAAAVI
ncbi:aminoglycoside phosphotransferase family protein [Glutamicibacter sp. NPDC087344]|uniref:aminoglycoside phosphotransferase family protein n=1 Tax=Glutamicibacter sp. NPDC087344 TaxID=3363994 RepID=UPI00382175B7